LLLSLGKINMATKSKKIKKQPKPKTNKKAKPKIEKKGLKKETKKQTKPKKSQHTKEIEKGLKSIYQDIPGKMPNMTRIEHKQRNKITTFVIFFIFCLIIIFIVSFLGFLIFQPNPSFTDSRVNLEIKGPFTAISGEEINYQIKIINSEDINLTNCQLTVYLPYGFILSQTNIPFEQIEDNTEQKYSNIRTWQINDLYSNTEKIIEISGKLIGQIDSKQTISATLSYTPVNFSSEFQKTLSFNTEIIDSLLDLKFEYPAQLADQEEEEFTVTIKNNSEEFDISNLEIELNYPEQFILLKSQINNNESEEEIEEETTDEEEIITQKIWTIDQLSSDENIEIKFTGKFEVEESQSLSFALKAKLLGPAEEYFIQQENNPIIEVIKGELIANLIIQGSNQNKPVDFSNTLTYLLNIQNKSKTALGDLKIRLVIESPFLDWSTLNDPNDGVHEGHQILWTKDQIPELKLLFPEDEVELNLQIDLKTYVKSSKYDEEDYQVKSFFETQINAVDNSEAEIIMESNTIINEINSNVDLKIDGRYFDDQNLTVGSGPLPPIVGQKTTYKVYWTLTNELHEISDINISTDLPDYVTFAGQEKISTGELFIKDNNQLVWQISRIPTSIDKANAEFSISIQPTSADIDKILTLLAEINLQATDAITNGKINKNYQGITTNLDTDPLGKGKGLVQEE